MQTKEVQGKYSRRSELHDIVTDDALQCDGKRPICHRCERLGVECVYDVEQEGSTRMQNLKQLLTRKTEDYDHLLLLFSALRWGTDSEAAGLLARVRLGEALPTLIQSAHQVYASVAQYVCIRSCTARTTDAIVQNPTSQSPEPIPP